MARPGATEAAPCSAASPQVRGKCPRLGHGGKSPVHQQGLASRSRAEQGMGSNGQPAWGDKGPAATMQIVRLLLQAPASSPQAWLLPPSQAMHPRHTPAQPTGKPSSTSIGASMGVAARQPGTVMLPWPAGGQRGGPRALQVSHS